MLDLLLQPGEAWWWIVVAILGIAVLRAYESRSVFKPSRKVCQDPSSVGLAFEEITFMAEDAVPLHGWWIPHPEALGTVLYCHGNAYNIGDRMPLIEVLHQMKVNVFIFDYRGYGKSLGRPSEKGLYRDARTAFEVVRARCGDEDQPPVVIYGCSLGGAVAIQLALEKPARGLVVEGTFRSIAGMAAFQHPHLPWIRWLIRSKFANDEKVPQLRLPKLFAHSRDDEVIPYEHGRELFRLAPEPKIFLDLKGLHTEHGWDTTPGYREQVEAFVMKCLG